MPSFNDVTLVGNLTKAPELKYLPSGSAVAEISLAVNERTKKDGTWQDEAHYFDCVLWGKTAENANQYLSKGSCVLVNGSLRQDRWEKDGKKHSKVRVNVFKLQFMDSKPKHEQASANYQMPPDDPNSVPF